jgi:hypothetical protein
MADASDPQLQAKTLEARAIQYSAYVEATERLVDRRAEANRFYVAFDLAIVGAIGFLFSDSFDGAVGVAPIEWVVAAFAVAGLAVSFNWLCIIGSQRKLLRFKFEVIHALEKALPFKPYVDEWDLVSPDRKKVAIGTFERRLPIMFMLFFILLVAGSTLLWSRPCGLDAACLFERAAAPFAG